MVNFLIPERTLQSRKQFAHKINNVQRIHAVWVNNDIELAVRMQIHAFLIRTCMLLLLVELKINRKVVKYERMAGVRCFCSQFCSFSMVLNFIGNCAWIIDECESENEFDLISKKSISTTCSHAWIAQHGSSKSRSARF